MNFETGRMLGGIGALMMFICGLLTFFNIFAGGIIGLIGLILVLISLNDLANFYKSRAIFNNALYGVIATVVGVAVAVAVAFFAVLVSLQDLIYAIYPQWNGDWGSLQGFTPDTSNIDPSAVFPFLAALLLVLVVVWIFAIIATFFVRRSLKEVSVKSATGLFSTTGLLFLIGAVLIIIFGLGILLMWIATLILAVAFFTLKPPAPEVQTVPFSPPTYT